MWTLAIPSVLLCFTAVITSLEVDDVYGSCFNEYDNVTGDTDCTALQDYLGCLEGSLETHLFYFPAGRALTIKNAKCTPDLPKACSCQKTLWGTKQPDIDQICTALTTYTECLNDKATLPNSICKDGFNVSTLHTNANARLAACLQLTCWPQRCKNGGNCSMTKGGNVTDGGTKYTCDCTSGYSGLMCEEGPCAEHPCNSHGTCKADEKDQTKPLCECHDGFSGDKCQHAGAANAIYLSSFLATLLAANIIRMTLT